jgi:CheY-like chemotaxis protein
MTEPTLLVVDPNPATVRRVEEAFADVALRVRAARDPQEAESLMDGADLAVVLASASLPRGNGYDLARALRERFPAAAILLMTGGFEVYNKARAAESGVSGHLAKPFSADAARTAVEAITGPLDEALPEVEPLDLVESIPAPDPPPAAVPPPPPAVPEVRAPLPSQDRIATILPRDYKDVPLVAVDPDVVGPALERAVMEVLPEVVEALLRNALETSPAFRDLVSVAVEEAVRTQLPAVASRVVEDRLAALEAHAANLASGSTAK